MKRILLISLSLLGASVPIPGPSPPQASITIEPLWVGRLLIVVPPPPPPKPSKTFDQILTEVLRRSE